MYARILVRRVTLPLLQGFISDSADPHGTLLDSGGLYFGGRGNKIGILDCYKHLQY